MRRLRDFQRVSLRCGEMARHCHVVAVEGGVALLAPERPDLPLPEGTVRAEMGFAARSHHVLLRGWLVQAPLPGLLAFALADGASVPEPRAAARLPLEAPGVVLREGLLPVAVRTEDLSAGGVRLAGWAGEVGTDVVVELRLPDGQGAFRAAARVVRAFPGGAALQWTEPGTEVPRRLGAFVLECRRLVAGRRAQAA